MKIPVIALFLVFATGLPAASGAADRSTKSSEPAKHKGWRARLGEKLRRLLPPNHTAATGIHPDTMAKLGIYPTKRPPATMEAFVPIWKAPSAEQIATTSPLKLEVFERRGTLEELNSFLYDWAKKAADLDLADESVHRHLKALYERIAHVLEHDHNAKELANGRIVALRDLEFGDQVGIIQNGTIVLNWENTRLISEHIATALAKAISEDNIDKYFRMEVLTGAYREPSEAERKLAKKYEDDVLLCLIAHELAHHVRNDFYGTLNGKFVEGYSSRKNGLSDQQKFDLFADIWGADLAIRAGVAPEVILAVGLYAQIGQELQDSRLRPRERTGGDENHARGNDRYHFLYHWIMRMEKAHKKQYRNGMVPLDRGPYLTAADLAAAKRFPLPSRTQDVQSAQSAPVLNAEVIKQMLDERDRLKAQGGNASPNSAAK